MKQAKEEGGKRIIAGRMENSKTRDRESKFETRENKELKVSKNLLEDIQEVI